MDAIYTEYNITRQSFFPSQRESFLSSVRLSFMHTEAGHSHHDHHVEEHFESPEIVRDLIIGVSDGLTVPFALAAGITGAIANNMIVVTAGIAEIAAGSIAMGLGGYLAGRSEYEHYESERRREEREVVEVPHKEEEELYEVFDAYNVEREAASHVVKSIVKDQKTWVDFMMRFELGLEKPHKTRALKSGLTIGLAYIFGGIIPLIPYVLSRSSETALNTSVCLTLLALLVFGYFKGKYTSEKPIRNALFTTLVGAAAAATAFFVARMIHPG